MKSLDEIGIEQQTDRASVFTRTYAKPHGYCAHYDRLFSPLRADPVKLLEIGVGGGEGIRMWQEYFFNGKIFGVDNNPDAAKVKGTTFVLGDQSSEVFWQCFIADYGSDWDVVIDDGSHFANHVIAAFKCLWPHVKPGGFYAIEDLGVAYSPGTIFIPPGTENHMDWIFRKVHQMNEGTNISRIHLSRELVVFSKQ